MCDERQTPTNDVTVATPYHPDKIIHVPAWAAVVVESFTSTIAREVERGGIIDVGGHSDEMTSTVATVPAQQGTSAAITDLLHLTSHALTTSLSAQPPQKAH